MGRWGQKFCVDPFKLHNSDKVHKVKHKKKGVNSISQTLVMKWPLFNLNTTRYYI